MNRYYGDNKFLSNKTAFGGILTFLFSCLDMMGMSYNEIRLVPGKERHRSVAELAQARKGMRHRDG